MLSECEGMGPELMGPYTAILYAGGIAALAALVVEHRRVAGWPAAPAGAGVPALVVLQRVDHRARVRQASERPRWWNRRLQVPAGVS